MKIIKIAILILLNSLVIATAQNKIDRKEKQLYDFLQKREGTTDWIIVRGLTNNFDYPLVDKKFILKNGVYYFYRPSSHSFRYIFTYSQGAIKINEYLPTDSVLSIYEKGKFRCSNVRSRLKFLENLLKIIAYNENLSKVD